MKIVKVEDKDRNVSIIFCPKSSTDNCYVSGMWDLLRDHKSKNYYKFIIGEWYVNFIEAYKKKFPNEIIPKYKFVFAHGNLKESGFLSTTGQIFKSQWWENKTPYTIGIFHACQGSNVLSSDPKWNEIFSDWVSYDEDLPIVFGLETDKRWRKILILMFIEAAKLNNGKAIKDAFINIYH